MRALRRIATPATVAALAGCSFPVDQLRPEPEPDDAAVLARDAASGDASGVDASDDGAPKILEDAGLDAANDACSCVEYNPGGKCKAWEPPGCR